MKGELRQHERDTEYTTPQKASPILAAAYEIGCGLSAPIQVPILTTIMLTLAYTSTTHSILTLGD
jgi:hypothetical protein